MKKKDINRFLKKEGEELQMYLYFKKRGNKSKNKKTYCRKEKHKSRDAD